jgi:hypothetical protein
MRKTDYCFIFFSVADRIPTQDGQWRGVDLSLLRANKTVDQLQLFNGPSKILFNYPVPAKALRLPNFRL